MSFPFFDGEFLTAKDNDLPLWKRTIHPDLPGLYFIGEVMDVTGHLGGYNFQWAWSSGVACGQAV